MAEPSTVHQFVPRLKRHDAVGNHTLRTREALLAAGFAAENWVEEADAGLPSHLYPGFPAAVRPGSVLLYQASTNSTGAVDMLLGRGSSEPLGIYYHGITPSHLFEAYDPFVADRLQEGRVQLARLAAKVDHAHANSEASARDLLEVGIQDVRVIPPYLAPLVEPDAARLEWLRSTRKGLDILFVGRVQPNKGQLDLLRAHAALRAGGEQVRLLLVGAAGVRRYMRTVELTLERLGDQDVIVTGELTDAEVAAHYAAADLFVCLSAHEGFGIPLVEAMARGLPVVALDSGAVAETLGGAGALLQTTDPLVVAEVVARLARDEGLRRQLVARGLTRAAEIEAVDRDQAVVELVQVLAASARS